MAIKISALTHARRVHPGLPLLLGAVLLLPACDLLPMGGEQEGETLSRDVTETASSGGNPSEAPGSPSEAGTDAPAPEDEAAEQAPSPGARDPLWRVDADGQSVRPVAIRGDCVLYEDGSRDCDLLRQLVDDALAGRELTDMARWLLEEAAANGPQDEDDPGADDPQSEDDPDTDDPQSEDDPEAEDDPDTDDPQTEDDQQGGENDPEGENDPQSEDDPEADDDPQEDAGPTLVTELGVRAGDLTIVEVSAELLASPKKEEEGRFFP